MIRLDSHAIYPKPAVGFVTMPRVRQICSADHFVSRSAVLKFGSGSEVMPAEPSPNLKAAFQDLIYRLMGNRGDVFALLMLRDAGLALTDEERQKLGDQTREQLAKARIDGLATLRGSPTHLRELQTLLNYPLYDLYQVPQNDRYSRISVKLNEHPDQFEVVSVRAGLDAQESRVLSDLYIQKKDKTKHALAEEMGFSFNKYREIELGALDKIEQYEQARYQQICTEAGLLRSERVALWLTHVENYGRGISKDKIADVLGVPRGSEQIDRILASARFKIRAKHAKLTETEENMVRLAVFENRSSDEIAIRLGHDLDLSGVWGRFLDDYRPVMKRYRDTEFIFGDGGYTQTSPFYTYLWSELLS